MDLLTRWYTASTAHLPAGLDIWDAHTHTGENDPDGFIGTASGNLELLDAAGHRGAVVMASQEPKGYPLANDRIAAESAAADGRLLPFLRIDPKLGSDAVAEMERCIGLGFVGVKLHPRGENFSLALGVMSEIAASAAEAGVPILIHAGRGIPTLGDDVVRLLEEHPALNLIMAHGAISDLGQLVHVADDLPGLFFDTAWWSTSSLLALVSGITPDRLLYASDTPYGSPMMSGAIAARIVGEAGFDQAATRAVMGGNLLDLVAGRRPDRLEMPVKRDATVDDPFLLAAYADLQAAIAQILAGGSGGEALQLASRSCAVPASHRNHGVLRAVARSIDVADEATPNRATAVRSLIVASSALLTPSVPVPRI
jgi:predicted TIM-barrel fold metal-dependent hydrolase